MGGKTSAAEREHLHTHRDTKRADMCTNAANDELNRLMPCGNEEAQTITLEYAAYMK